MPWHEKYNRPLDVWRECTGKILLVLPIGESNVHIALQAEKSEHLIRHLIDLRNNGSRFVFLLDDYKIEARTHPLWVQNFFGQRYFFRFYFRDSWPVYATWTEIDMHRCIDLFKEILQK